MATEGKLLINKQKQFLKNPKTQKYLKHSSFVDKDYFWISFKNNKNPDAGSLKLYIRDKDLLYKPVGSIFSDFFNTQEKTIQGKVRYEITVFMRKGEGKVYFKRDADKTTAFEENPSFPSLQTFFDTQNGLSTDIDTTFDGIEVKMGGNIMSLIYADFEDKLTIPYKNMFNSLFLGFKQLVSIKDLKLPATTLSEGCYRYMFDGCFTLTTVPYDLLPATTLKSYCYDSMFYLCIKLKNTPNLPATTLATHCYSYMFYKCESLRYAQRVIQANYIEWYACQYMFQYCTKLLKSPIIKPESGFGQYACQGMFYGCTSLVDAGEIGIKDYRNAGKYMFNEMFQNCKSLVVAPTVHFRPYSDGTMSEAESMFQDCTSLVDASGIKFYSSKIDSNNYNFAKSMFENCKSLTKTPDMKTTAGAYMFKNCTSLVNVTNSDTTLYVKDSMFMGCSKLKTVGNNENFSIYLSGGYAPFCFDSCTSLTTFPKIKSQSSYEDLCCSYMFANCTSLSKFPNTNDLVNFKLSNSCFNNMFNGCTSITTLPKSFLSNVNALKESCYKEMFYGCTSLKVAPELSAETINVNNAYKGMFTNCTSLTTAKLSLNEFGSSANHVCQDMFNGCSKLSNVSVGFTSFSYMNNHKNNNLSNWLNGVASSGIMNVPNTYAWTTDSITHSVNGIPSGWVVNPVL